jgi:sulfide:quinone oxidoreductase
MIEKFLERLGIEGITNNAIREVRDGEIELDGGRVLPFAYSMIVPPFTGVDAITQTDGLANPMGFIPVNDHYRHTHHDDIYAGGVAIAIAPPAPTPVPAGVPKTGQMTETMAKVAARNIAADIDGSTRETLALEDLATMCILDAGNNGVIFKASLILGNEHTNGNGNGHAAKALMTAGPHAHLAKLAFERVYLGSRKRGQLVL